MESKFHIASITDEFSPADPAKALSQMASIGMTGAELRVLYGKNIMDLSKGEMTSVRHLLQGHGMEAISIASPILKCVLPNAPDIDTRFQQDIFNSKHTYEGQAELAERAFKIAFALWNRSSKISKAPATTMPRASPIPSPIPQNLRRFGNKGFVG